MTEDQFYKSKIFEKKGLNELKNTFPHLKPQISNWYKSRRYNEIQERKQFLLNKLKQMSEDDNIIQFTDGHLYELYLWWNDIPKQCHYCSLPDYLLETLRELPGHINKRYPQRGRSLEIDRKISELPYTNINNLVLACYWCNNAKTDTFLYEEFIPIGHEIKKIWEKRLNLNLQL